MKAAAAAPAGCPGLAHPAAVVERDERPVGGIERDEHEVLEARPEHHAGRLRVDPDVELGRDGRVSPVVAAAHDDRLGDPLHDPGLELDRHRDVGQRSDRHERDRLGRRPCRCRPGSRRRVAPASPIAAAGSAARARASRPSPRSPRAGSGSRRASSASPGPRRPGCRARGGRSRAACCPCSTRPGCCRSPWSRRRAPGPGGAPPASARPHRRSRCRRRGSASSARGRRVGPLSGPRPADGASSVPDPTAGPPSAVDLRRPVRSATAPTRAPASILQRRHGGVTSVSPISADRCAGAAGAPRAGCGSSSGGRARPRSSGGSVTSHRPADHPVAAGVEDAAGRRVGRARDLALEQDPRAVLAVDVRDGRQERLGVRVVRARGRPSRTRRPP